MDWGIIEWKEKKWDYIALSLLLGLAISKEIWDDGIEFPGKKRNVHKVPNCMQLERIDKWQTLKTNPLVMPHFRESPIYKKSLCHVFAVEIVDNFDWLYIGDKYW